MFKPEDDPPTMISQGGEKLWMKNGVCHREFGPAVVYPDGLEEWWVDGELHRLDGPAYVRIDGYQAWYQSDKRHRLDGPAIIYPDGSETWFVHGYDITLEVISWIEENDLPPWKQWTETEKVFFALTFR